MALVKCKECGAQISSSAKTCPQCGKERSSSNSIGCGTIILGFFIIGLIGSLFSEKNPHTSTPEKPKTAAELHQEKIESQFSAWDGSHRALERYIKDHLKDPDSYEHIKTTYIENADKTLTIYTKYRAKNSFGGYVIESAIATATINGELITVNSLEL